MLEVKWAPSTARNGLGFLNCASTGVAKGTFVKLGGVFASDAGPTGKAGKPGYAKANSIRWDVVSSTIANTGTKMGIVTKLEYQEESSDLTLDNIVSGESVLVFLEGMFETDQYATDVDGLTIGARLWVSSAGKLQSTAVANAPAVAIYWGKKTTFDSDYHSTGLVLFELIPNAWEAWR